MPPLRGALPCNPLAPLFRDPALPVPACATVLPKRSPGTTPPHSGVLSILPGVALLSGAEPRSPRSLQPQREARIPGRDGVLGNAQQSAAEHEGAEEGLSGCRIPPCPGESRLCSDPSHAALAPLALVVLRSAGWGPPFPGGSWDPEIQELWYWGRTATPEVECPGFPRQW